jgi:hypothetical protein
VVRGWLLVLEVGESVNNRVSHGAVARREFNAGADAMLAAELSALLHLTEHGQTLLGRAVTALASKTIHAVSLLNLGVSIVGVGISVEDHLLGNIVELLEVVARVCDLDIFDVHELEILQNSILKLLLLFCGVCIVESNEELAVGGLLGEVIVEEGGLGVTDVKETTVVFELAAVW